MLLADIHLLGSRHEHWFDKLKREWQQHSHKQFQTPRHILQPDLIFIVEDFVYKTLAHANFFFIDKNFLNLM